MAEYIKVSGDGKYGLSGPDKYGYHYLFKIMGDKPVAYDEDLFGPWEGAIQIGAVADPENFETAIDEAEEEMRVLVAQAKEEFGFA